MAGIIRDYENTKHIPKFGGVLWYVNKSNGSDSNSGKTPETAFETIGTAISASAIGDAITVMAGIYTEVGINLNKNAVELWFEIGVIIAPASGTALIISGNYCKTQGELRLKPTSAVGLQVTGEHCKIQDVFAEDCTIAFDIDGDETYISNCHDVNATTTGFDISNNENHIHHCSSIASGGASRGFYLSNANADRNVIHDCISNGNGTASFEVVAGCTNNVVANCSSGSGDGRWIDAGTNTVWNNWSYDDELMTTITLDGSTTYNLFEVTGAVRISDINAQVTTAIASTSSTMYLQLFSTGGTVDITDAPGRNIQADVAGTIYVRNEDSTNNIDKAEPNGSPAVAESTNFRDPKTEIDIVGDDTNPTYVRMVLSAGVASGVMNWHCHWRPITDNGFLKEV